MPELCDADLGGLSSPAAAARLTHDGPNELPAARRPSALRRLVQQLFHFFAVMLWVAAGLAFVAGLAALGIAIVVVVLLNALFAFFEQSRADRAAAQLRALLPFEVAVRRDGQRQQVDARGVVVGDVVLLESGDRIPADAVTGRAAGLLIDTSLLTGESVPSAASAATELFAGTFVVEGEGEALVTATEGGPASVRSLA